MRTILKSTFGLVFGVMALFAVIATLVARSTSRLMVEEAQKTVRSVVRNTISQIDRMMTGVETAVANQEWVICEHLDEPEYMYRVTRELVENNDNIVGSTVAFVPNHFKAKGFYFAPYTCDEGGGKLKSFQLGTDSNRYHEQGWFSEAVKAGKAIWSEPYFDEGGAKILMCTYSLPIRDKSGRICAVFTADLALERFTRQIAAICPYPDSYAIVRSEQQQYVVQPSAERTAKTTGRTFTICDRADNGWTVEIVCPIAEILSGAQQLVVRMIVFSVIGLGLIFVLSWAYSVRLERAASLRERMAGELNAARAIQSGLLSRDFGEGLFATLRPAREVGGDLYDFARKGDRLYVIVGDASGKGVPAALFSFMAGTVFRLACDLGLDAGEIVSRINATLARSNETSMFVTAFVGVIDLKSGEIEYSSAGHNPPVVVAPDGSCAWLPVKRNVPAGAVEGRVYETQRATLARGSKLIVYTDGVTEAERANHAQYGEERLLALAKKSAKSDVAATVEAILKSVDGFVRGAEQFDDITIMAVAV